MKINQLKMIEEMASQAHSEYSEFQTNEYTEAITELNYLIHELEKFDKDLEINYS